MIASESSEDVVDYARFDFASLWAGRDKVTAVERSIVREVFVASDRRRILEIGTGFGRLLPVLTQIGEEVVATDLDAERLADVSVPFGEGRLLRVAANLYHLPFADESFTGATMVRVYHHLLAPERALAELSRVLRGGSTAVVSYQPLRSVGSLIWDIQHAFRRNSGPRTPALTFGRGSVVLDSDPFPIRVLERGQFTDEVRGSGLEWIRDVGAGFEEYSLLRQFPSRLFVRGGTALGRAPAFPTRFAVLSKRGSSLGALPAVSEILACPQCRTRQSDWSARATLACRACGFHGTRVGDLLDLRFVPPGTPQWKAVE
jgi:SAM-dependent methyltransferase